MADETEWIFDQLMASPTADVRTWLQLPPESWNLGELSWRDSVEFVNKLFLLEAIGVIAAEVTTVPEMRFVTSNHLIVELPSTQADRIGLFEFEREHAQSMGFDGCDDRGQRYLYFKMK